MSNALTTAARSLAMDPSAKAVLMALCDMAREPDDRDRPCEAWPPMHGQDGAVGLCDWTCFKERAVQHAIQRLVEAGIIVRRQRKHGVTYTVLLLTPAPSTGVPATGVPATPVPDAVTPAPDAPKALGSTSKRKKTSSSPSMRNAPKTGAVDTGSHGGALALPALPTGASEGQWADYVEMRVAMSRADKKRPWTPTTARKAIEKLSALALAGSDPGAVLDQSVLNTWQGLFPVKDDQHGRRPDQGGRGGGTSFARDRPVDGFTAALREIQARAGADDYGGS
jgi:hypothetical protein